MIVDSHRFLPIVTADDLRCAQAEVARLSALMELSAEDTARANAVAACMAGDLLRAPQAQNALLLRPLPAAAPQTAGLELIAVNANGSADPAAASGAAAIAWSALADVFDTYLRGPRSTALLARVYSGRKTPFPEALRIGGVSISGDPQEVPGNGWAWRRDPPGLSLLLVEGAGQGPVTHRAVQAALDAFYRAAPPANIAHVLDESCSRLLDSGSAAAGICQITRKGESLQYLAVGGMRGRFVSASPEGCRELVAIASEPETDPAASSQTWPAESCLVLSSASLPIIDAARYPGLLRRDPTLIAAQLLADHRPDDGNATVVVVQNQPLAAT